MRWLFLSPIAASSPVRALLLTGLLIWAAGTPNAPAQNPIAALTPGLLGPITATGNGGYSGDGGPALKAKLNVPGGVAIDAAGNIYFADVNNYRIRKIDTQGVITTIAGNGTSGFSGDGGLAIDAEMSGPLGVAVDKAGNVYFVDYSTELVRKVDTHGTITTVAGVYPTGGYFGDGGPATQAGLARPYGLATDAAGNLYIGDTGNNVVRRVDAVTGVITTVAGNGNGSNQINDYCGNGAPGSGGYSGDGGPATSAELWGPRGVRLDAQGNLYIADTCNNVVRKVDAATGVITTVAGNDAGGSGDNTGAFTGDGGPAIDAQLNLPSDVAVDAAGDLFITDAGNYRVRKVDVAGTMTTVAGNGSNTLNPGTNPATATGFGNEYLVLDAAGNLYLDDYTDNTVLKVTVNASALNFPTPTLTDAVDSADGVKSVVLSNLGAGTLDISGMSVPQGFSRVSDAPSTDCGASLAPGANCNLRFEFTPESVGPLNGTFTLSDNSLNANPAIQTISLSGTGLNATPIAQVSPTPLNFATIALGSSETLPLTITNIGGGTLTLAPSINGPSYTITGSTCGAGVTAGNSCTLQVQFAPIVVGNHPDILSIQTNGGNLTVSLNGLATGVGAQIETPLNFGAIPFGATKTLPLVIKNSGVPGSPTLTFNINGPSYKVLPGSSCVTTGVAAGQTCTVKIEFAPVSVGGHPDVLTLTPSVGPASIVSLRGSAAVTGVFVETATLQFGTIPFPATKVLPLTITNVGVPGAVMLAIGINGPSYTVLAAQNTCLAGIAAGHSCTLMVKFAPVSVGSHPDILTVTPSGGAAPSSVSLAGVAD